MWEHGGLNNPLQIRNRTKDTKKHGHKSSRDDTATSLFGPTRIHQRESTCNCSKRDVCG